MSAQTVWNILLWVHYFLLSLWIGGIFFFTAVAAPAIRRSMASKAVAGEIVNKILKRFNLIELICCFTLISFLFSSFRFVPGKNGPVEILMGILTFMGLLTYFYAFRLAPRMESIRQNTPTFHDLSKGHASRQTYERLHRLYVRLVAVNFLLGLGVLYGSIVVLH